MKREIEDVLKGGIRLGFRNTLLLVNEDLDFPVSEVKEAIKELNLNTIAILKKFKTGYCITEIRDSGNLSHVLMSLEKYKENNPQDWIRLKDVLRRNYPDVLKDIGEYYEIDIYH